MHDGIARIVQDRVAALLHHAKHRVAVIGIDGPTAAGKTILADQLAQILPARRRRSWIYRMDWTLADRGERVADLARLRAAGADLPFEGERHMHLDDARAFLRAVKTYNQRIVIGRDQPEQMVLTGLYDRGDGGRRTGTAEVTLAPGQIILVEGHYTLRAELDGLIDYQILLLADPEVLLSRKRERVSGYRGTEEATDYFRRIDLPSFAWHAARFGTNADLVIDNSDPAAPRERGWGDIASWCLQAGTPTDRDLAAHVPDPALRASLARGVDLARAWDRMVGERLRGNPEDFAVDLRRAITAAIEAARPEGADGISVTLDHCHGFNGLPARRLPVGLGLALRNADGVMVGAVLALAEARRLTLLVLWDGGPLRLVADRELASLDGAPETPPQPMALNLAAAHAAGGRLPLYTDAPFLVPGYLVKHPTERRPASAGPVATLLALLDTGGAWASMVKTHGERRFWEQVLAWSGIASLGAGRALLALRGGDPRLRDWFRTFGVDWRPTLAEAGEVAADQDSLDEVRAAREAEAEAWLARACPDLVPRDGVLLGIGLLGGGARAERAVQQLRAALEHENPEVRHRAAGMLRDRFGDVTLPVASLWPETHAEDARRIRIADYLRLFPTPFGDVYTWLALRDSASAVLAANVYDLRSGSLDLSAHFAAAATRGAPIVLQASLNAVGQAETDDEGKARRGYLKPDQGPEDLIDAVLAAARDHLLETGSPPPPFGIGLDHVNVEHDRPKGRAKRFLDRALATGCLTHATLDGAALFNAAGMALEHLRKAMYGVTAFYAHLLDRRVLLDLDLEYCTNQLLDRRDIARSMVPTRWEMGVFVQALRQRLAEEGLRPLAAGPALFVGNLGTTHHGADRANPPVYLAEDWRDLVKRYGLVSAVLHGTTDSKPETLTAATRGCHKVNVAGDFLAAMMQGLPTPLRERLTALDEPKRGLADLAAELDALSTAERAAARDAITARSAEIMELINAPRLEEEDIALLCRPSYRLPQGHAALIATAILAQSSGAAGGAGRIAPAAALSPSLIEVPFGERYRSLCEHLRGLGLGWFHVDVGDGRFIPRTIPALDKVAHLSALPGEIGIHVHLMVRDPDRGTGEGASPIEAYAGAGAHAIGLHRRAFADDARLREGIATVRQLGRRPGLVIETSEDTDGSLSGLIRDLGLDWVVVMGVPVGFGGQLFDPRTPDRVAALRQALGPDLTIEVDGGLTPEAAARCRAAGASILAGWSFIRGETDEEVSAKVGLVRSLIEDTHAG